VYQDINLKTKIMNKSKPNDETQSFIKLLIEELNRRSVQCPNLKQYVFCIEDNQWIAQPKHPLFFSPEEGYYVRNLRKLVEYIDCNYSREISELFAADMIGLSVPEFCRFFRKQTGMSFVFYKNKVRIEQAARMLVETGLTCEQVGWDCGFASYHYFKRVFEKYYRMSPNRYRKNLIF